MQQSQEDREQTEALMEVAAFGRAVNDFWDSPIGQYLLEKSLEEYNSALEEFKKCTPTDSTAIMNIQGRMWRAESFKDWLSQSITAGIKALDILEGNDE